MKKPILVVTSHFITPVESRIESQYEVRRKVDGTLSTRDELLAAAEDADAMLITPFDKLDAEFFKRVSPSVKVISTYSVGFDHIDVRAAAERNIAIGYTPAEVTDATADVAMLLLLGASRRAFEAQNLVRTGEWTIPRAAALLGWQITGKTLGILGMGRIGQAVAKRARAFGMKIHYSDPHELPREKAGDAIFHADPIELLKVSQFLSLHAPELETTHHLLNAANIARLPQGAIVVNAARGGLIVDDDLIAALKSGHIAAAGLDVYDGEPKLHPGYIALKNTFLLPHIGTATIESRTNMGMVALDNIDAVLNGSPRSTTGERFARSDGVKTGS
ncbi:MAG TPA: D-glycerate dehydrogenase [Bryobacteraceae bacterium]|jgi:lactate dehydrogenase-like 2-hydroxyacid dehydrogenase|nr:D-glycerate dehydrogenase [Bryobacteraceae bacterium]